MARTKSAIRRDLEDCQRSLMRDVSELMDNLTAFFAYPTDKESGKTALPRPAFASKNPAA